MFYRLFSSEKKKNKIICSQFSRQVVILSFHIHECHLMANNSFFFWPFLHLPPQQNKNMTKHIYYSSGLKMIFQSKSRLT